MKPVVDGIEARYAGQLVVIRLDIHTTVGKQIAEEYDFQYTPTFILFNGFGEEVWRTVGSIDESRLAEFLERP